MDRMYTCPKCHSAMHTYDRHGVHIEQCDGCRGIFLDYGELEALTQIEAGWAPVPPAAHGVPAWGAPHHGHYGEHYEHHGEHYEHKSFVHMLFSS